MLLVEFECKNKKCKHAFTRLFKDKKEREKLKEKCKKCNGEDLKEVASFDLSKNTSCGGGGCDSCSGCGSADKK